METTTYEGNVGTDPLNKIAQVKERIDYVIILSIIVAIALGSFSLISIWSVLAYITLVGVYQFNWSNEAIIKQYESRDSSYEFNEANFLHYEHLPDDVSNEIARDAAQVLLTEFDQQEIIQRSGNEFYEELVSVIELEEENESKHAA